MPRCGAIWAFSQPRARLAMSRLDLGRIAARRRPRWPRGMRPLGTARHARPRRRTEPRRMTEQRKDQRFDVHLVVRYASAEQFVADHVENLSENGIVVAGADLPLGHEAPVEIVLPGQGEWTVRARVVFLLDRETADRAGRNPGAGMLMIEKPPGFDEALLGYLLRLGRRRDNIVML